MFVVHILRNHQVSGYVKFNRQFLENSKDFDFQWIDKLHDNKTLVDSYLKNPSY
jgi:hypothetical protein